MKKMLTALLLCVPRIADAASCDAALAEFLQQLEGNWQVEKNAVHIGDLEMRIASGGCALIEEWRALDGTHAAALHWIATDENGVAHLNQVYVEDNGWVMRAAGAVEENVLVYRGDSDIDGETVTLRVTLHGAGTEKLVHIGDLSRDEGASWQRISTLEYHRQPGD